MRRLGRVAAGIGVLFVMTGRVSGVAADNQVTVTGGTIQGTTDAATGIHMFKGIPYAAPPVGDLRWQPPHPVKSWTGVRQADHFGPRCMQQPAFSDMVFRSDGMSEDCLDLNVWTPATSADAHLPVLVYYYGGGYIAGDGSEPRYDGESMARRGIVALTVNYRLGVFGFFAHPELTKESPHHSSGNYALLDQVAALQWVHDNIAAFGGDPGHVSIAGESAGSISVSALMASPLSRTLIAGAIGESGAMINPTLPPVPLAQAEQQGEKFAATAGADSLAKLRAVPAEQLLNSSGGMRFSSATIDGWVLPKAPVDMFEAGEQAHVPLLAGSNSLEQAWRTVLQGEPPTPENYAAAVKRLYPDHADEILKLYPGATVEQIYTSADDLASDRFIAYSTWKWLDASARTGGSPTYYYYYARPRPAMTPEAAQAAAAAAAARPGGRGGRAGGQRAAQAGPPLNLPPAPPGAVHSAEIEYAMGNLDLNKAYAWTDADRTVSATLQGYFANFIKTGNPNGQGLPNWPATKNGVDGQRMHVNVTSDTEPITRGARYQLLDRIYQQK